MSQYCCGLPIQYQLPTWLPTVQKTGDVPICWTRYRPYLLVAKPLPWPPDVSKAKTCELIQAQWYWCSTTPLDGSFLKIKESSWERVGQMGNRREVVGNICWSHLCGEHFLCKVSMNSKPECFGHFWEGSLSLKQHVRGDQRAGCLVGITSPQLTVLNVW